MLCWQPCKALLVEEDANVALHQTLALSGLNNRSFSQAKGPQQESVVKKKFLLQLCLSIPQLLALKHSYRHGIWIISHGVWHLIMRLVQNILSLLKYCQQKGGGG
jgi:hypothetical protein